MNTGHELVLARRDLDEIFPVNAATLGYVRDLSHGNKIDIGRGGFLRIRPSHHVDHALLHSDEMK